MNLIERIRAQPRQPPELSSLLLEMAKFGRPKLSMMDSGWHCWIQMNTNAVGAQFEVRSDFGLNSPLAAAVQCHERSVMAITLTKEHRHG